ncbi:MAG: hypothetical protein IJ680_04415 [Paludibacteraceae bacterium]|nr:hypothetical protein [Paludibacteraceae bacterium]
MERFFVGGSNFPFNGLPSARVVMTGEGIIGVFDTLHEQLGHVSVPFSNILPQSGHVMILPAMFTPQNGHVGARVDIS